MSGRPWGNYAWMYSGNCFKSTKLLQKEELTKFSNIQQFLKGYLRVPEAPVAQREGQPDDPSSASVVRQVGWCVLSRSSHCPNGQVRALLSRELGSGSAASCAPRPQARPGGLGPRKGAASRPGLRSLGSALAEASQYFGSGSRPPQVKARKAIP